MNSRLLCQSLTGEEENRETRYVLADSHLGCFVDVRFRMLVGLVQGMISIVKGELDEGHGG